MSLPFLAEHFFTVPPWLASCGKKNQASFFACVGGRFLPLAKSESPATPAHPAAIPPPLGGHLILCGLPYVCI